MVGQLEGEGRSAGGGGEVSWRGRGGQLEGEGKSRPNCWATV